MHERLAAQQDDELVEVEEREAGTAHVHGLEPGLLDDRSQRAGPVVAPMPDVAIERGARTAGNGDDA